MKTPAIITVLLCLAMSGCEKPYKVETLHTPVKGVYFTVATYSGGSGLLGTDTTKVYAHFVRDGGSARSLVLEGDSLTVSRIIWRPPNIATICLDGGLTAIFHNQVTLDLSGGRRQYLTIRNRLREHCPRADLGGRKRAVPSRPNQAAGGPVPK